MMRGERTELAMRGHYTRHHRFGCNLDRNGRITASPEAGRGLREVVCKLHEMAVDVVRVQLLFARDERLGLPRDSHGSGSQIEAEWTRRREDRPGPGPPLEVHGHGHAEKPAELAQRKKDTAPGSLSDAAAIRSSAAGPTCRYPGVAHTTLRAG